MNKEKIKEIFENDPQISNAIDKLFLLIKWACISIIGLFMLILVNYYLDFRKTKTSSRPKLKQELHLSKIGNEVWEVLYTDTDTLKVKFICKTEK